MKSQKPDFVQAVLIDGKPWGAPYRIGLRPYVDFTRHLDRQLEELVARWVHTAAPQASQRRSRRM